MANGELQEEIIARQSEFGGILLRKDPATRQAGLADVAASLQALRREAIDGGDAHSIRARLALVVERFGEYDAVPDYPLHFANNLPAQSATEAEAWVRAAFATKGPAIEVFSLVASPANDLWEVQLKPRGGNWRYIDIAPADQNEVGMARVIGPAIADL